MNDPRLMEDRVVKAAIKLDACLAEFGDDFRACNEYFQELHIAVSELTGFKQDMEFIKHELSWFGRETPGMTGFDFYRLENIRKILNKWTK